MTNRPCIRLDAVTVRHGSVCALDNVTIRISVGERVALVGPSGAGKSTFISLANTSLAPSAGNINLFGSNPSALDRHERTALRRRIGTMYQGLHMAGALRVIHNVNAGHLGEWSTCRMLASLVQPRASDQARAALVSVGIGEMLWRRTDELSGGERQRVALARLIVQQADLIFADEPTASLDPARADDVLALLNRVAAEGDRTLVVSLHAFDLARAHFSRVIGLRAGRVMFDLPTARVTDELGARLYNLEDIA